MSSNHSIKKQFSLLLCCILLLSLCFIQCNRDATQATASIEGTWDVMTITSYYGDFSDSGFNPTETIEEAGNLGSFEFTENTVDFEFSRNDTLFSGSSIWDLNMERVNAGFVKVPEFTLTIEEQFLFIVAFEDETKNAEKDAMEITFAGQPIGNSRVFMEISLEKR
ncbi:MAG: hypothetical protein ACPGXL_03000 [Chitinophagales bacterium]